MPTEKSLENKMRRILAKSGYSMHKSRRQIRVDNWGGYMIVDIYMNAVVAGSRFELSLPDVEQWVKEML